MLPSGGEIVSLNPNGLHEERGPLKNPLEKVDLEVALRWLR
jgi:hypothetical protein